MNFDDLTQLWLSILYYLIDRTIPPPLLLQLKPLSFHLDTTARRWTDSIRSGKLIHSRHRMDLQSSSFLYFVFELNRNAQICQYLQSKNQPSLETQYQPPLHTLLPCWRLKIQPAERLKEPSNTIMLYLITEVTLMELHQAAITHLTVKEATAEIAILKKSFTKS